MIVARLANINDKKDIFEWRNNFVTRNMSHCENLISWKSHCFWFSSCLKDENKILVMFENNQNSLKIGIVHFHYIHPRSIISINLNPKARGKGLAKQCLILSINFFIKKFDKCKFIEAEIKKNNKISKLIFEDIGFNLINKKDDFNCYEYRI